MARKHSGACVRYDGRDVLRGWLAATTALAAATVAVPALGASAGTGGEGAPSSTPPAEGPLLAQADEAVAFDIPAQALPAALNAFGRQAGLQVTVEAAVAAGASSQGVRGTYTPAEALDRLLAGTGIVWRMSGTDTVVLERPGSSGIVLDPLTVESAAAAESRFGDAPPEAPGFAAEYQTTATKTPLSLRETPQAISVTTTESMVARQARDLNTALELTAGVSTGFGTNGGAFAGSSLSGDERFTLRGEALNTGRDIRLDGFASGGRNSQFDLSLFERVEVIKGPSSVLYGQGSLGGFINLVRKRPQVETAAAFVGQVASFDTYRGEFDLTGAIDPNEVFLGRITAAYEDAGSFIDGVESNRIVAAPSLEARIGERTRALVQVMHQEDDFIPSNGIPLRAVGQELVAPAIPRSFFFGAPSLNKSTSNTTLASARIDHELSDRWLTTLLLHGSRQDRNSSLENYGYGIAANGDTGLYASRFRADGETWAGELRLDGRFDLFGREHHLLAGVEANRRELESSFGGAYVGTGNIYTDYLGDAGRIALPSFGENVSTSFNQAAYGQVVLSLLERTRLLVGVRYDQADQRTLGAAREQDESSAPTFRAGVTQGITDNVTAYAIYAQSFNPVGAVARGDEILDPETGEGFELGLKTAWFDGGLVATIAAFQQELDNRPIDDPSNGPGEFFSISGGLQRTKGVELEVSGSPLAGVTVGAAASLLDTKLVDPIDPDFGLHPQGFVERQASLFGSYQFQTGSWRGLGFGATVVSVGERILLQGGVNQFVEGYERVDLHAYYSGVPGWDFSLQVRNVFDSTYIEQARQAEFGNYFGAPRAVLFRAEVDF